MIRSAHIRNFRCFSDTKIDGCQRINLIVGDNGSGKTTILEALFFALGASSDLGLRFRQQRGLEGHFAAAPRRIEEAIWRDLFHKRDWSKPLSVELVGDGPEARSLRITRGSSQLSIPFIDEHEQISGSISLLWKDSQGKEHIARPKITKAGVEFDTTGEDLPDFFYFAASFMPASTENAGRFSELSRAGRSEEFTRVLRTEYDWIENLSIEVLVGAPVIYASLKGSAEKIPLPLVSGGINRIVSVMLAIAARSEAVVLVDEMEDGLHYLHHEGLWRAILAMARNYNTQLFITSHSEEWIHALARAAGNDTSDISLWRVERTTGSYQPEVFQFNGETLRQGIEQGAEVRGGTE